MYTRGPDTGRERVLTQRRGNGDDGAGGECTIGGSTFVVVLRTRAGTVYYLQPIGEIFFYHRTTVINLAIDLAHTAHISPDSTLHNSAH